MKIKITQYCQEKLDNKPYILDRDRVIEVSKQDGERLISNKLAIEINVLGDSENRFSPHVSQSDSPNHFENKMVDVSYKKRGRPKKEVKDGNNL